MTIVLKYVLNNFKPTWLNLYLFKCSKSRLVNSWILFNRILVQSIVSEIVIKRNFYTELSKKRIKNKIKSVYIGYSD